MNEAFEKWWQNLPVEEWMRDSIYCRKYDVRIIMQYNGEDPDMKPKTYASKRIAQICFEAGQRAETK